MVLLPYGFLLEDNALGSCSFLLSVLLPYGFLLEDNMLPRFKGSYGVLLPYIYMLDITYVFLQMMLICILTDLRNSLLYHEKTNLK